MYYEVNVALNGRHFFATSERSCVSTAQIKVVYLALKDKFPESEGYTVEIGQRQTLSTKIDPDQL